jgi:hypothetical protein
MNELWAWAWAWRSEGLAHGIRLGKEDQLSVRVATDVQGDRFPELLVPIARQRSLPQENGIAWQGSGGWLARPKRNMSPEEAFVGEEGQAGEGGATVHFFMAGELPSNQEQYPVCIGT